MRVNKYNSLYFSLIVILVITILVLSYFYFDIKKEYDESENINSETIQLFKDEINLLNDSISYFKIEKDSLSLVFDKQLEFNKNLYKFNWENVCFWVDYYKIKHPDIVKGQILLETNYLTSEVCRYNHNLFGMKLPINKKGRKGIGLYKNHAVYNNYIESIEDYKIWQDRYYKYNEDYYKFLKRIGYAKDDRYILKLKHIVKVDLLK
jgi:hypothetical protein